MFNFLKSKESSKNIALILASGRGSRFGSKIPKQYLKIEHQSILRKTISAFVNHPEIDHVKVVINNDDQNLYNESVEDLDVLPAVFGGKTRSESVKLGVASLADLKPNKILVHDACRPFVSAKLITRCLADTKNYDCVVPVLPIYDAIKKISDHTIEAIDRKNLFLTQTPQVIDYNKYKKITDNQDISSYLDEASIFLEKKLRVGYVKGDIQNRKITVKEDLGNDNIQAGSPHYKIGSGFDAHKFAVQANEHDNYITLGAIKIPFAKKIIAHSDGDVLLHALVDAIFGAISEGDIGDHFPPSEMKWKDVSSEVFLQFAKDLLRKKGFAIANIDCTVICEAPKISPYKSLMREKIATILKINIDQVNIKATTTEKMGFTGRKEGIAANVVVLVATRKN